MPESLPAEVLEAIIDQVSDDDSKSHIQTLISVCLTSKALVPRAQKNIYSDITIHPASDSSYSTRNLEHSKMYQRTVLLVDTLLRRPTLAFHVKRLKCSMTTPLSPEDSKINRIAEALSKMVNVCHFTYRFTNLSEATHDGALFLSHALLQSHVWLSAIAGILQTPTLRSLRLQNFRFFPPELLQIARGVVSLELFLTTIAGPKHFWDKISSHVLEEYDPTSVYGFRRLDITWHSSREPPSRYLLSHCGRLTHLRVHLLSQPTERQSRMEWPVYNLHVDNLENLTHLDVQVDTYLRGPHTILYYMYGPWRWDLVLPKLSRLESLNIQLNFQGHFGVHHDTFGPQWGAIASVLHDQPGVVAALKEITMTIDVRIVDTGSNLDKRMSDAETLLGRIREAVGTYHSLALIDGCKQGRALAHSVHADVSVTPSTTAVQ